jgi:hypothetical protein
MSLFSRTLSALGVCAAFLAGGNAAHAADVLTKVVDFGMNAASFSTSFGNTFAPTSDTFHDDYAFGVGMASFSSFTATFDLSSLFVIDDLSVRLFKGTPGAAGVGTNLTEADLTFRTDNTIATGVGDGHIITAIDLAPGNYVLEVSGRVTGSSGGTYTGLLNVSPVPEPASAALVLAGLGMLGAARLRRKS